MGNRAFCYLLKYFFNSSALFNSSHGSFISVLPMWPNAARSWYLNSQLLSYKSLSIPLGVKSKIDFTAFSSSITSTFSVPNVSTFTDVGSATPIA